MLITCGKCGNDVSDKAKSCPKCKTPVKPVAIACPECGKDLSEQDLSGDCPHCGYPLRHLRLSSFSASASIPPAQVPKAAALECANCGCVLPTGIAADGKCPNCGFAMRPERPVAQGQAKASEKPKPRPPSSAYSSDSSLSPLSQPSKAKESAPKSRLRSALDLVLIIVLLTTLIAGGSYIVLRNDLFGIRSSLRSASSAEETEESLQGSMVNARLWIKHAVSVILDQLPDGSVSGPAGVEGQTR